MPPKKSPSTPKKDSSKQSGTAVADQLQQWRERCADEAADFKKVLDECNDRVNSRTKTEETCAQEMRDYVKKLDKCAMPKAFAELK